jgi:hypothetical protein
MKINKIKITITIKKLKQCEYIDDENNLELLL